jgi:hypothetical protein
MNNLFNRFNPFTSSSSPAQPNQPQGDFDYSDINTIPVSLQPTFNNLKKAINDKKNILEQYKGLYATLQSMNNGLLDSYITDHANTTLELNALKTEKQRLEEEKEKLIKQPRTNPEDQAKIAALNQEIEGKQNEIVELTRQQSINVDNMTAITKLLEEATTYINNMYPTNNTEITDIQSLINEMKGKLQGAQVERNPDNFNIAYPYTSNPLRGDQSAGYRYSSSQMRRKSTAKRSSSSGSSSSKRRRNKKRTARKNMLGGKRMKKSKTKSKFTKRKNHKKH